MMPVGLVPSTLVSLQPVDTTPRSVKVEVNSDSVTSAGKLVN